MQMRPAIQIQSMIKSITDVVLPAIDPSNKLAQEQTRLILGTLSLMAKQLPLQYAFDCDELGRLNAFAQQLQAEVSGGDETQAALAALASSQRDAQQILDRAGTTPDAIEAAVRTLRATTGSLITGVYRDGDAHGQQQVKVAVLAMSKEQLLRDRAWVAMQGWEPDPAALPTIDALLAASGH